MTTNRLIRGLHELNTLVVPQLINDTANTFSREDMGKTFVADPSATRIQTLPTTGVGKGEVIAFVNLAAAQKITIEASGGGDIATFQDGYMQLMAKQDEPTTAAHWMILHVTGGASPAFRASRSSNQSNITGTDKILHDNIVFDYNDNYDNSTNYRFQPTVPGLYQFIAVGRWLTATLAAADLIIYKVSRQGTAIATKRDISHDGTNSKSQIVICQEEADGLSDYFEVFAQNVARDTSSIQGSSIDNTYFGAHRISS